MKKNKIFSLLLIIISLFALIAVNAKVFAGKKEAAFKNIDIVRERYLRTLNTQKEESRGEWKVLYTKPLSDEENNTENSTGQSLGVSDFAATQISATSALVVNNTTGEALLSINPKEKRPIASLVKIMTAVIALEHGDLDAKITVSKKAALIGENAMGISEGEVYTLRELLYGMLLNSGNDAATAIAEGIGGNVEMFVKWMNIKAQELSLKYTYFADPSGLDNSSYSTAEELSALTHYALKYPEFREMVRTVEKELPASQEHTYISLSNQTNLLTTYPGVLGVKTGYTEESGLCLVSFAVNDGKEIIGVVLNSANRKIDMIKMLDYGFSELGLKIDHPLLIF